MPHSAAVSLAKVAQFGAESALRSHATPVTFEAAFRREFEERYEPLARYLARLTGDPAAAADLAQEAFVRLYGRGSMPDNPRAWLVSVAHNLLRNERQQAGRRLQLLDRHAREIEPRHAETPGTVVEAREQRELVRRALDTMPLRDRQLLLLRYEGFSYRELAGTLGINEASIGTLLARAKTAFRAALGVAPLAEERDA